MALTPVGILSKLKAINNATAVVPKKISIADAINSDDLGFILGYTLIKIYDIEK